MLLNYLYKSFDVSFLIFFFSLVLLYLLIWNCIIVSSLTWLFYLLFLLFQFYACSLKFWFTFFLFIIIIFLLSSVNFIRLCSIACVTIFTPLRIRQSHSTLHHHIINTVHINFSLSLMKLKAHCNLLLTHLFLITINLIGWSKSVEGIVAISIEAIILWVFVLLERYMSSTSSSCGKWAGIIHFWQWHLELVRWGKFFIALHHELIIWIRWWRYVGRSLWCYCLGHHIILRLLLIKLLVAYRNI